MGAHLRRQRGGGPHRIKPAQRDRLHREQRRNRQKPAQGLGLIGDPLGRQRQKQRLVLKARRQRQRMGRHRGGGGGDAGGLLHRQLHQRSVARRHHALGHQIDRQARQLAIGQHQAFVEQVAPQHGQRRLQRAQPQRQLRVMAGPRGHDAAIGQHGRVVIDLPAGQMQGVQRLLGGDHAGRQHLHHEPRRERILHRAAGGPVGLRRGGRAQLAGDGGFERHQAGFGRLPDRAIQPPGQRHHRRLRQRLRDPRPGSQDRGQRRRQAETVRGDRGQPLARAHRMRCQPGIGESLGRGPFPTLVQHRAKARHRRGELAQLPQIAAADAAVPAHPRQDVMIQHARQTLGEGLGHADAAGGQGVEPHDQRQPRDAGRDGRADRHLMRQPKAVVERGHGGALMALMLHRADAGGHAIDRLPRRRRGFQRGAAPAQRRPGPVGQHRPHRPGQRRRQTCQRQGRTVKTDQGRGIGHRRRVSGHAAER